MGLAASQSRFLLLTSRKNSLSSQIMSLTNQGLALERQSAVMEADYNRRQNQQMVTYNDAEIDYASIMQPSPTGAAQVLTNSSGAVMLTGAKAASLGLSTGDGTPESFKSKYPTQESFVRKFVSNYGSISDLTDSANANYNNSAYKYEDTLLNNAVVSVSATTILGIGGYLTDSEGNAIEGATMEYAMGTQQNDLASLACIYSLNEFQYTESNVHSVVNEFVTSAASSMSEVLTSTFGNSDTLSEALDFATRKTQEKYAGTEIIGQDSDVDWIRKQAENGNMSMLNTTGILVSEHDYTKVNTTAVHYEYKTRNDATYTTLTTYDENHTIYSNKDVYVNTAQLTATFLNYFDAYMAKKEGSKEAEAYYKHVVAQTDGTYEPGEYATTDALSTRNRMRYLGLNWVGNATENLNVSAEDIQSNADNSKSANNMIYLSRALSAADEYGVYEGSREMHTYTLDSGDSVNIAITIYPEKNATDGKYVYHDANGNEISSGALVGNTYAFGDKGLITYTVLGRVADNSRYDAYNTYNVRVVNNASTPMTFAYDLASADGKDVINTYGNKNLLSNTFDTAATGVYGSKNLAGDDYNSLVSGNAGSSTTSTAETSNASIINYYKSLYNALYVGGWQVDSKLSKSDYLSQQMLAGNVVLNQFNGTKSWSALQLGDSSSGLATVDDEETQKKAKSEYEAASAILETRQKFIESQLEVLNTMSEEIDKEKESIQSLIETEQEKFKVFVSG